MKTSDIVRVNISNIPVNLASGSQLNPTAAVVFVHKKAEELEIGNTDTRWLTLDELDPKKEGYVGEDIIDQIEKTYSNNGGLNLVYKRIYLADDAASGVENTAIVDAILGDNGHEKLETGIVNVQLAWDNTIAPSVQSLASSLLDTESPQDTKILFVTSNSLPLSLSNTTNVFWHYSNTGAPEFVNYYESAAAMAYLSRINYSVDSIQDYEYTDWLGTDNAVNLVSNKPSMSSGHVNFFTELVGRKILIGGTMTNAVRLITYYFGIILTQRITDRLVTLTLNKMKFTDSSYATIFNVITLELDIFALNGLLDQSFVSNEQKEVFIDDERYVLLEKDEQLLNGYKVNVLPASDSDIANRVYSGTYIHLAIANQIRTINVSGLVIGGVK